MRLVSAARDFLEKDCLEAVGEGERRAFRLERPRVHRGLVASGDQFVNERGRIDAMNGQLPGLVAVEMEGAAVAQVCYELNVPCAVIRAISDNANENAAPDFMRFVKSVAAQYAFHITRRLCRDLKDAPLQARSDSAGT